MADVSAGGTGAGCSCRVGVLDVAAAALRFMWTSQDQFRFFVVGLGGLGVRLDDRAVRADGLGRSPKSVSRPWMRSAMATSWPSG